jgi:hypothetical protein
MAGRCKVPQTLIWVHCGGIDEEERSDKHGILSWQSHELLKGLQIPNDSFPLGQNVGEESF